MTKYVAHFLVEMELGLSHLLIWRRRVGNMFGIILPKWSEAKCPSTSKRSTHCNLYPTLAHMYSMHNLFHIGKSRDKFYTLAKLIPSKQWFIHFKTIHHPCLLFYQPNNGRALRSSNNQITIPTTWATHQLFYALFLRSSPQPGFLSQTDSHPALSFSTQLPLVSSSTSHPSTRLTSLNFMALMSSTWR